MGPQVVGLWVAVTTRSKQHKPIDFDKKKPIDQKKQHKPIRSVGFT